MTKEKNLTGFPSIDKPWLKYYDTELINNTTVPDVSVYNYIYEKNLNHLNDTALIFFGRKVTYRKMFRCADRIAECLSNHNVRKGDFILVCMTGTPETVELLLACSKIGACALMINPTLQVCEICEIISESNSDLFFCMDKLYPVIEPALDGITDKKIIIVPAVNSLPAVVQFAISIKEPKHNSLSSGLKTHKVITWKRFLNCTSAKAVSIINSGIMPLAVVFSSGTTGKAKGIVHSNRSYVALSVEYECNGYPFERGDRFLYMIPSFIAAGLSYTLFAPLAQGITMILDPIYNEKQFVLDILKYKPNIVPGTKSFWYEAINDKRMNHVDLSNLKIPVTGGEAVFKYDQDNINTFLKQHGCNKSLYVGWGMSELNATISTTAVQGNSMGSSGIPLPNVTVSVFDVDTGEECTYDEYGELRVLSPCAMLEYYRNPVATNEFFYKDNSGLKWCCTGDIGYINKKGEIFVLGRKNDCFFTQDNKRVYLFDIENVIMKDERVDQCKVVDMDFGEYTAAVAHIVLKHSVEGNIYTIISEIDSLSRGHLADYAVPKLYKIRASFPLTPNGKRDICIMSHERNDFYYVNSKGVFQYEFTEK